MSSGLAVALLLAIMLILLALGLAFALVLRKRALSPRRDAAIPGYRHDLSRVQYTVHQPNPTSESREKKQGDKERRMDIRHRPLPKCGSCGSALAYGDTRCAKCGSEQQTMAEKVI